MPSRKLANWLSTYMEYTANLEAPDSFHFWAGVWAIGAALRQKTYFDQGHFRWTPNFYIVFVAPPGIANKSTTANVAKRLLKDIPGINFGPDSLTWQVMIEDMANCAEAVLMPDGLYHNHSCMTFCASELGSLLNFEDKQMLAVLVDLWEDRDSDTWRKRTKHSGSSDVQAPWLNILACTTPSWIADSMPKAVIGGGFTSRCVFVYENKKRHLVAYPKLQGSSALWNLQAPLIHDLEAIAQLVGEYKITKEAYAFGIEWYRLHYEQAAAGQLGEKEFGGYLSRKQCHCHKLAMVLSAAEGDSLLIEQRHLENSISIITALEADMPKVFGAIHATMDSEKVIRLASIVRQYKKVSKSTLFRMVVGQFSKQSEFEEAITGLITMGYVESRQEGNSFYLIATEILLGTPDIGVGTQPGKVVPFPAAFG